MSNTDTEFVEWMKTLHRSIPEAEANRRILKHDHDGDFRALGLTEARSASHPTRRVLQ